MMLGVGKLYAIKIRFSLISLAERCVLRTASCQFLPKSAEATVAVKSPVWMMFFTIRYSYGAAPITHSRAIIPKCLKLIRFFISNHVMLFEIKNDFEQY